MKKFFIVIVLLNLSIFGWSQSLVVAVTDFTARSGYTNDELLDITELFAGFLRDTGAVRVVTRSQWEAILTEHQFQRGGLVAQNEIRQLGVALGAQAVIAGTMMKLGNSTVLNLSLLDVQSGEMLSAARNSFEGLDEFLNLLPTLAADIVKLLEKTSPLVGQWKTDGWPIIFVFNKDGTFEFRNLEYYTYSGGDFERPNKNSVYYGYYNKIIGTLNGTYKYTEDEIITEGKLTGTITRYRTRAGTGSGERTDSRTINNETVIFTFKYKLNGNKLVIPYSELLLNGLFFDNKEARFSPYYLTDFTKIN